MVQKRLRSPSPPKEEAKQPGNTLLEESKKYNDKVNSNYNEIMAGGNSTSKPSSAYKRTKSADPNTSVASQNSASKKEGGTYVQKLLGLNRQNSSSSSKYHNNVPSWQQLLKCKQQAMTLPNPLERFQRNASKRKLSFGRDSSNNSNKAPRHEVSMNDINR